MLQLAFRRSRARYLLDVTRLSPVAAWKKRGYLPYHCHTGLYLQSLCMCWVCHCDFVDPQVHLSSSRHMYGKPMCTSAMCLIHPLREDWSSTHAGQRHGITAAR